MNLKKNNFFNRNHSVQVIYAVSKRHQNFIIQELLMTFQNNEEAEEKYFTFPLIHVLISTWCFCFVFIFCVSKE